MKACGIVVEYNPFHNGHLYHLQQAKALSQCDCVIAVMSGHFVQRGEPAIAFRHERMKAALANGADLVVELPYPYNVQSADYFAYGAIETLKLLNIDALVFGSESSDIEQLKQLASMPVSKTQERSFAAASSTLSNDILGIAYLRQLRNTNIKAYALQRTNTYHDTSLHESISSATAIRNGFLNHQDVSHATCMQDAMQKELCWESYYPYLRALLRTHRPESLKTVFLCDEGLEYKLIENARKYDDYSSFLSACVSARYTRSRIQRTLVHILTQLTKAEANHTPIDFVRVLGFNDTGRAYLSQLDKTKLAMKFSQLPKWYRALSIAQCEAYAIVLDETKRKELLKWEFSSSYYVSS